MAEKQAPAKSGKGKLVGIAVAALVVLGAGGGAAWWFLLRPKPQPSAAELAAQRARLVHYIPLDSITTNVLSNDGATHYLQVKMELKTADPKAAERLKDMAPEVSNQILRILGSQQADRVASVAVREQLQQQIMVAINQVLGAGHGDGAVTPAPAPSVPRAAASAVAAPAPATASQAALPATASQAAPQAAPPPALQAASAPLPHFSPAADSPIIGVYFDEFVVQ